MLPPPASDQTVLVAGASVGLGVELARELCRRGYGVTLDYPPMRHMSNLESVRTYEGTDEVHTLILGGAITGILAVR